MHVCDQRLFIIKIIVIMLKQRRQFDNRHNIASSCRKETVQSITPNRKSGDSFNQITIKLIGDVHQNINDLTSGLDCSQFCKDQIKNILLIYSNKIDKLRQERNFIKEVLIRQEQKDQQQINALKDRIDELEDQIKSKNSHRASNCQKCTCFDDYDRRTDKFTECRDQNSVYQFNSQSSMPLSVQQGLQSNFQSETLFNNNFSLNQESMAKRQQQDQMLMESSKSNCMEKAADSLQISDTIKTSTDNTVCEEELAKLMLKYNINVCQLEQILQDYDRQYRQADELFDSENQKQLYRLGQRMQRDLWNKKVMKDVKNMSRVFDSQR